MSAEMGKNSITMQNTENSNIVQMWSDTILTEKGGG